MTKRLPATLRKTTLDTIAIGEAVEWLRRYYPSFWERVSEEDLMRLVLISHTLFKSNPEILEAPLNKSPTQ